MTRPIISTGIKVAKLKTNDLPALLNQRVGRFLVNESYLDKIYLYYFTYSDYFIKKVSDSANATNQPNVSSKQLEAINIVLPKLPEQQKIADILSTVDEQIEQTDQLIEKTKELKKGLMQKLLTKGIGHTKFKKTEVGEIPEEWEVTTLGDVTEILNGGTPNTNINEYWTNGTISWATPTDITSNGKYISNTKQKITEKGLNNSSAKLLPSGSVLMTSRATIGECSINTLPMATNQGFKSFICKEKIINEFLYYKIDSLKNSFVNLSGGSTFLEISKTSIADFKISLPPTIEQQKIASILSSVDNQIEQYETKKQKLEQLKKGLMQQLLTGKIRVKVS